jgi:4-hydroxy-tetrahydrodipicolinate synthase
MQRLQGVFAIMATPFDEQGRLDEGSLKSLVEFELTAGVAGLTILGIMGEAHKLADEERRRVVEVVVEQVNHRVPVVVGTSHSGTEMAARLSREAEEMGAAAVMVAPSSFAKTPEALREYYGAVARAIRIPIVLQDEPATTGVLLPASLIVQLVQAVDRIAAVKLEEPPTPVKVSQIRRLAGEGLDIFGGLGGQYFLEELLRGAVGTMTGFAYPEILVAIQAKVRAGKAEEAALQFYRYLPLIRFEGQVGIGLAIRKEILRWRGAVRSATLRSPGMRMDPETGRELHAMLDLLGLGPEFTADIG